MSIIIDYFVFIVNKLIDLLDSISFNGSPSLLYYFLGVIIIGFIIKLIKGGSNEFERSFNFSSSSIITSGASKYSKNNSARKKQIIKQNAFKDGFVTGLTADFSNSDSIDYVDSKFRGYF